MARIQSGSINCQRGGTVLTPIGAPQGEADGEPVILSVSGALSQGSTLTISGSNFSAKRSGQLAYRNFDDDEANLGDPLLGFEHGLTEPYRYSNDGVFAGNRFARCHMQGGFNFDTRMLLGGSFKEIFCEQWLKILPEYIGSDADTPDEIGDGPQIKLSRISSSIDDNATYNPSLGISDIGVSGSAGCYNYLSTDDANGTIVPAPAVMVPLDGSWFRISMYCRLSSSPGMPDGERYIKTSRSHGATNSTQRGRGLGEHFASPAGVVPIDAWHGEQIVTQRLVPDGWTQGEHFRSLWLPFYTRRYQKTVVGVDLLMINDSPERVVISNRATWAESYDVDDAGGKAVTQKTESRGTTEIAVSPQAIEVFGSGESLYLYVVNSDGKYNENGYLVRAA